MSKLTEQLEWRKAKRCGTGTCVEVAKAGDQFFVRDSKNPERAPLRFSSEEWDTFVDGIRGGDFDFS